LDGDTPPDSSTALAENMELLLQEVVTAIQIATATGEDHEYDNIDDDDTRTAHLSSSLVPHYVVPDKMYFVGGMSRPCSTSSSCFVETENDSLHQQELTIVIQCLIL
jgi:hypothetical protein